jgi:putative sigma-54 modulation protein
MKITIVGRQMNVWDSTKEMAEKKLARLDKYFGSEASATVTFSCKRERDNVEITIHGANTIFRAEVDDTTFQNAMDRCVEAIDRQIRKNKTRLERRAKEGEFYVPDFSEILDEDPEFIVRTKEFELTPMSVEEAIMQMNLIGHQFFVFFNDETGNVSVVYTRKDGTYGLINPIIYK